MIQDKTEYQEYTKDQEIHDLKDIINSLESKIENLEKQLSISRVSNSKRFEKQDLLRAYQAGAIEQKDNNLNSIDAVTFGNLQEDSQVWYERYIG